MFALVYAIYLRSLCQTKLFLTEDPIEHCKTFFSSISYCSNR